MENAEVVRINQIIQREGYQGMDWKIVVEKVLKCYSSLAYKILQVLQMNSYMEE